MVDETDSIVAQIENDVRKLEAHSDVTGSIRKNVITKLSETFGVMTIDPDRDKASTTEAKMNVVNTLLKALSDADQQKIDIIKLKQRMKADTEKEDSVSMISSVVTDFLKRLNTGMSITKVSATEANDSESALDDVVTNGNIEVLPGELELSPTISQSATM